MRIINLSSKLLIQQNIMLSCIIDPQNSVHLVYECFNHLNFNFIMCFGLS